MATPALIGGPNGGASGPAAIYDNATHALSFDQDGLGGTAQVLLGHVMPANGTSLHASDFFVM